MWSMSLFKDWWCVVSEGSTCTISQWIGLIQLEGVLIASATDTVSRSLLRITYVYSISILTVKQWLGLVLPSCASWLEKSDCACAVYTYYGNDEIYVTHTLRILSHKCKKQSITLGFSHGVGEEVVPYRIKSKSVYAIVHVAYVWIAEALGW